MDTIMKITEVGCICYRIPYVKLLRIIKEKHCKTIMDVQKYCDAGQGCGMCKKYITNYCKETQGDI